MRILLGALVLGWAAVGPAQASVLTSVTPLSAAGFRDSIGVNTHVGYTDTAYANWGGVVSALEQLGVTHVRDLLIDNGVSSYMQQWTANVEAAAAKGIRFDFVMPEPGSQLGSVSTLVSTVAGPLRQAVDAVEDPNEYDLVDSSLSWSSTLSAYDQSVYTAVRSNPALSGVPVIGPSLVNSASYQALGDQSAWLDMGNLHPYQSGMPFMSFIQQALATESVVAGSKPTWVTEFGDSTALNSSGGYPPVSQTAAAIYLLRTYLLDYVAGIPRSYVYELVNEQPDPGLVNTEDNFGLLNSDLTPKLSYTALKNFLQAIGTPAATSLVPLQLGISSSASDLRSVLLQSDATHYQLVLWNDVSVWDSATRQDIAVPDVGASISAPPGTAVTAVRPLISGQATSIPTSRSGAFSVSVPADPIVLSLTLPGSSGSTSGSGSGSTSGSGSGSTSGSGSGSTGGTGSGSTGGTGSGSTSSTGSGSTSGSSRSGSTSGRGSGSTSGSGSGQGLHGLANLLLHELQVALSTRRRGRFWIVGLTLRVPDRGVLAVELWRRVRRRWIAVASTRAPALPNRPEGLRLRVHPMGPRGSAVAMLRVTFRDGGQQVSVGRRLPRLN